MTSVGRRDCVWEVAQQKVAFEAYPRCLRHSPSSEKAISDPFQRFTAGTEPNIVHLQLRSPNLAQFYDCGAVLELQQQWPQLDTDPPSFAVVPESHVFRHKHLPRGW